MTKPKKPERPYQITRFSPNKPEKWASAEMASVKRIYSGFRRGLRNGWKRVHEQQVQEFSLVVLRKGDRFLWFLNHGSAGIGKLVLNGHRVEEALAILTPRLRGRRIYWSVLHALKLFFGTPVFSDRLLSDSNLKQWQREGIYDADLDRYHNPPRPRPRPPLPFVSLYRGSRRRFGLFMIPWMT